MTKDYNNILSNKKIEEEFNRICDECKKKDESVLQNLIISSYKICNSCKLSKTLFPV